jgi:hypothetical protein
MVKRGHRCKGPNLTPNGRLEKRTSALRFDEAPKLREIIVRKTLILPIQCTEKSSDSTPEIRRLRAPIFGQFILADNPPPLFFVGSGSRSFVAPAQQTARQAYPESPPAGRTGRQNALLRRAVPPLNSPKPGVIVLRRPSRHEPDPASAGKARPPTAPHPSSGMGRCRSWPEIRRRRRPSRPA